MTDRIDIHIEGEHATAAVAGLTSAIHSLASMVELNADSKRLNNEHTRTQQAKLLDVMLTILPYMHGILAPALARPGPKLGVVLPFTKPSEPEKTSGEPGKGAGRGSTQGLPFDDESDPPVVEALIDGDNVSSILHATQDIIDSLMGKVSKAVSTAASVARTFNESESIAPDLRPQHLTVDGSSLITIGPHSYVTASVASNAKGRLVELAFGRAKDEWSMIRIGRVKLGTHAQFVGDDDSLTVRLRGSYLRFEGDVAQIGSNISVTVHNDSDEPIDLSVMALIDCNSVEPLPVSRRIMPLKYVGDGSYAASAYDEVEVRCAIGPDEPWSAAIGFTMAMIASRGGIADFARYGIIVPRNVAVNVCATAACQDPYLIVDMRR